MISIITAAHKILNSQEIRVMSVLQQDYDDWEWIILDNSIDGKYSKFMEYFFNTDVGKKYLHKRDKIKIFHEYEMFKDVTIKDGRIGKLKERCLELSSCTEDEYFLILDYDDYLYDGYLSKLDKVIKMIPSCECITGMFGIICHTYNDYFDNLYLNWLNDCKPFTLAEPSIFEIKEYNFKLNVLYNFTITDEFTIKDGFVNPFVFKKKAFKEHIGFNTLGVRDDLMIKYKAKTLKDVVYINSPCYLVNYEVNKDMCIDSTTNLYHCVESENNYTKQPEEEDMYKILTSIIDKYKDKYGNNIPYYYKPIMLNL